MKTTENISLAGYAFTIESDAYAELESYLNEIRRCFSGDPSAEEIVADIEERIAELIREEYASGMVVELGRIKAIESRIGDPKDLAQDNTIPSGETGKQNEPSGDEGIKSEAKRDLKDRRLYRNIGEKVFGGVCSGLGVFFGVDKVLFRIAFMLLTFIGLVIVDEGPFLLLMPGTLYICLWIAMPAARSAEQKREMLGKPLDLNSYKSGRFDFVKEVKDLADSPAVKTTKRTGGVFLGILLLCIGLAGLLGCIFIPSIPHTLTVMTEDCWQARSAESLFMRELVCSPTFWWFVLGILLVACIWFIYNGVMLIFDMKQPSWRPGLVIFIIWIVSIFIFAGWLVKMTADALPALML